MILVVLMLYDWWLQRSSRDGVVTAQRSSLRLAYLTARWAFIATPIVAPARWSAAAPARGAGPRGRRSPARRRSGGPVARRIVGKLAVVANHQHPATGSHTTGKIIVPEPGGPASPLSE